MSDGLSQRSRGAVGIVAVVAAGALVADALTDPSLPDPRQWSFAGVLMVVAVAGYVASLRFGRMETARTPPWDVHSTWLLPAALLVPPAGFAPLLALSLVLGFTRRAHSAAMRIVVASITVLTTVTTDMMSRAIDNLVVAGFAAIAVMWLVGLSIALAAAQVFVNPLGTALWLDYRWSLVQLGCSFSGLLVAVAMAAEPLVGLAALAPLLLASFALHWPELERLARIDPKTGLPNARHWEDRSRDLVSAAAMHENPVAVLILDIDHFKDVNDSFGHLVGDEVLESVASTLRSQVNPGDMLGRFGGEEFVVTLFDLSPDAAVAVADRIRRAVAGQRHRYARHRVVGTGGDGIVTSAEYDASPDSGTFIVTCTIGIATSARYGYRLDALLDQADQALGEGKAAGRNQLSVAGAAAVGDDKPRPGVWRVASQKQSWMSVASQQRETRRQRQPR